jgi:hypothetical protein
MKYKFAKVTDKIYNKFIDTGQVPDNIIKLLAIKLINNETLNDKELAIFYATTSDINEMIVNFANEIKPIKFV